MGEREGETSASVAEFSFYFPSFLYSRAARMKVENMGSKFFLIFSLLNNELLELK